MSEIIRLAAARKERERAAKKAQADANAVKHGRTKAERLSEALRDARSRKLLDGHETDTE